jgi:hypothetical protein
MELILDSWSVFLQYRVLVLTILGCAAWGVVVLISALKWIGGDHLAIEEYLALCLAGWLAPVFLAFTLLFFLNRVTAIQPVGSAAFITGLAGLAAYSALFIKRRPIPGAKRILLVLVWLFLLFVILRLVFIAGLLLPQYFDSVEHYRIARMLAVQFQVTSMGEPLFWPAPGYYHLGFHMLTAVLAASLQVDVNTVMLVLGQIILACIPIPFFFIVKRITGSHWAGLWAVVLAGFGWLMPVHAVNWGKYPALASILTIQFSGCMAYLLGLKNFGSTSTKPLLRGLFLCSVIVSLLFHTRSVIVIAILVLSWSIAGRWIVLAPAWRSSIFSLTIGFLAFFIYSTASGDLRLTFEPYLHDGILVTGIVIILFPFGLIYYPRPVFAGLLNILLMSGCLFVPARIMLPGIGDTTLLDRPYVQMLLFMPLTWIGGLGCAGLLQALWTVIRPAGFQNLARMAAPPFLSAIVVVYSLMNYSLSPSDCCRFVGYDDAVALDWLDKNLAADVLVAIPSAELTLHNPGSTQPRAGVDAGLWITPLMGRRTILLPHTLDFHEPRVLNLLCEQAVSHIYAGGMQQSFMPAALRTRPEWYDAIFFLPGAQIFEISGCR